MTGVRRRTVCAWPCLERSSGHPCRARSHRPSGRSGPKTILRALWNRVRMRYDPDRAAASARFMTPWHQHEITFNARPCPPRLGGADVDVNYRLESESPKKLVRHRCRLRHLANVRRSSLCSSADWPWACRMKIRHVGVGDRDFLDGFAVVRRDGGLDRCLGAWAC